MYSKHSSFNFKQNLFSCKIWLLDWYPYKRPFQSLDMVYVLHIDIPINFPIYFFICYIFLWPVWRKWAYIICDLCYLVYDFFLFSPNITLGIVKRKLYPFFVLQDHSRKDVRNCVLGWSLPTTFHLKVHLLENRTINAHLFGQWILRINKSRRIHI